MKKPSGLDQQAKIKDQNSKKNNSPPFTLLIIAVIILMLVFAIYAFMVYKNMTAKGSLEFNIFGDAFGIMSALFSGCAFAGMIYAILLQRQELSLQREELTLTREVLEESATQQKLLAETTLEQLKVQKTKNDMDIRLQVMEYERKIMEVKPYISLTKHQMRNTVGRVITYEFEIKNVSSNQANNIRVYSYPELDYLSKLDCEVLNVGESRKVELFIQSDEINTYFDLELSIIYLDIFNNQYEVETTLQLNQKRQFEIVNLQESALTTPHPYDEVLKVTPTSNNALDQ